MMERILTRAAGKPFFTDLDLALEHGAYGALRKALTMPPEAVIEEVKLSQLRGRGGAGFPAGQKWEIARAQPECPKYVICNADEGEPGTFKDRGLLRQDPHLVIEAMVIAGHAVGAQRGYIYIRGEFFEEIRVLDKALQQARQRRFLGEDILNMGVDFDILVYTGAGAYICGDETALFQSMEGKRANPREKPPFPVQQGFLNKPTVINNVETLCNVPFIVERGGAWYAEIGPEGSRGPKLFCVSGNVNKPGVYELPMGVTLRYLIEKMAGGVKGGKFKAALPGGVASALIADLDTRLDFDSLRRAGSMMGSGAVIVMNDKTDMVDVACNTVEYFIEESCGQCTPCREGTMRAHDLLRGIMQGHARAGDLDLLLEMAEVMRDTSRCGLGQSAMNAVTSAIRLFRREFEAYSHRESVAR